MYKRIILKLSGETLAPEKPEGAKSPTFDALRVEEVARVIAELAGMGVQVGVVMGGGNIWRGRFSEEMNAVNADQMGMLATVINALAVEDALCRLGRKATVFTAQEMNRFARLYTAKAAIECMENGEIVLLAGGTGNPFFTTDTGAALRAAELKADAVFKGTTVEGVYDSDPHKNPDAQTHPRHQLPRGRHPRPARHGPDRLHALHGAEGAGGARVLHGEPRQHPPRGRGGGSGHHRTRMTT